MRTYIRPLHLFGLVAFVLSLDMEPMDVDPAQPIFNIIWLGLPELRRAIGETVDGGKDLTPCMLQVRSLNTTVKELVRAAARDLGVRAHEKLDEVEVFPIQTRITWSGDQTKEVIDQLIPQVQRIVLDRQDVLYYFDPLHKFFAALPDRSVDGLIHLVFKWRNSFIPVSRIHKDRLDFRNGYLPTAPSNAAKPSIAKGQQLDPTTQFYYDRPRSSSYHVPVTLLEPIFNKFVHNCTNITPTVFDNTFAYRLCDAGSSYTSNETIRKERLDEVFNANGFRFTSGTFGRFQTDGDIRSGHRERPYLLVVREVKNEASPGDPVIQSGHYYYASLDNKREELGLKSYFPAIGLYVTCKVYCSFCLHY